MRAIRVFVTIAIAHFALYFVATGAAISTSFSLHGWEPRSFFGRVAVWVATALIYPTALLHQWFPDRFDEVWDSTGLALLNSIFWAAVLLFLIGATRAYRSRSRLAPRAV